MNGLRETLERESVGPIIRRFFINTLFDSTFILLGIIVGSAFAADAGLTVITVTMLTTSFALGISTGVSVYEAESLEQERKISDLEKALFTDLDDTNIQKTARKTVLLATLINFATPLFSCAITITPFLVAATGLLRIDTAAWISVALALKHIIRRRSLYGTNRENKPLQKRSKNGGLRSVGLCRRLSLRPAHLASSQGGVRCKGCFTFDTLTSSMPLTETPFSCSTLRIPLYSISAPLTVSFTVSVLASTSVTTISHSSTPTTEQIA